MSRSPSMIRLLAAAGLFCFVSVATLRAQEKVQLRVNLPPGSAWTFSQTQEMNLDTTVKAGGQQQQMQQKITRRIAGTAEVLEADSRQRPTAVRASFDQNSGGQMVMGGQSQPIPFQLAGQTITVRVQNGQVSHDFKGQLDPQLEQELKSLVEQDDGTLPDHPVGPGDSWSADPRKMAEQLSMDPASSKVGVQMTLKELRQEAGRRVAVVDMNAEFAGSMQGMSGSGKVTGTAIMDVETGRPLNARIGGNIALNGTQQQQMPNGQMMAMDLDSKGTMNIVTESQMKSAGAAGGMAGPAPAPGPLPLPDGMPPVAGGQGGGAVPAPSPLPPPGGAAVPVAPLSGAYTDGNLTVKFSPPGPSAPPIAGYVDIALGDQQFKGTVQSFDGRAFKGSFASNGASFDFNGTVNGQEMTFSSGGTDYHLKPVAENKNPLGR